MKNYFEEIGIWPHSHHTARAYIFGFVVALLLTLAAYALVVQDALSYTTLIAAIIAAALAQFAVQVYCFLHIGGRNTLDRLFILAFAIFVVAIVVGGSLWIMLSLNGRMMPNGAQEEQYMSTEGGF